MLPQPILFVRLLLYITCCIHSTSRNTETYQTVNHKTVFLGGEKELNNIKDLCYSTVTFLHNMWPSLKEPWRSSAFVQLTRTSVCFEGFHMSTEHLQGGYSPFKLVILAEPTKTHVLHDKCQPYSY